MSTATSIEWTVGPDGTRGATWNPTTGCDRISEGCRLCYALTQARRLKAMGSAKYQNDGDPRTSGPGFALTMHPSALLDPIFKIPRRGRFIFLNSMSDVFHARVTPAFLGQIFATMAITPQHTYQVLTKRPRRMRELLADDGRIRAAMVDALWSLRRSGSALPEWNIRWLTKYTDGPSPWPLPNVWLGTSVESADYLWRAGELAEVPAAVRMLSCEPLLGPLDGINLDKIGWVIVGGESGAGARPMDPQWARALRDECIRTETPFFFKQFGAWVPTGYAVGAIGPDEIYGTRISDGPGQFRGMEVLRRVGKKNAGRTLDGRTWSQYPSAPAEGKAS